MKKIFLIILYVFLIPLFTTSSIAEINISHAIAMHGDPKYKSNFEHVDYVNPQAYKGGKVIFSSIGSYDTFNPFTLKGVWDTNLTVRPEQDWKELKGRAVVEDDVGLYDMEESFPHADKDIVKEKNE